MCAMNSLTSGRLTSIAAADSQCAPRRIATSNRDFEPDRERTPIVSCPINTSLAAPRLFAPGGVAPPRHSARYASSARLARHENSRADRARYLWDRTLGSNELAMRVQRHQ